MWTIFQTDFTFLGAVQHNFAHAEFPMGNFNLFCSLCALKFHLYWERKKISGKKWVFDFHVIAFKNLIKRLFAESAKQGGMVRPCIQKYSSGPVFKKATLKRFAKFKGKHLCKSLFFNLFFASVLIYLPFVFWCLLRDLSESIGQNWINKGLMLRCFPVQLEETNTMLFINI